MIMLMKTWSTSGVEPNSLKMSNNFHRGSWHWACVGRRVAKMNSDHSVRQKSPRPLTLAQLSPLSAVPSPKGPSGLSPIKSSAGRSSSSEDHTVGTLIISFTLILVLLFFHSCLTFFTFSFTVLLPMSCSPSLSSLIIFCSTPAYLSFSPLLHPSIIPLSFSSICIFFPQLYWLLCVSHLQCVLSGSELELKALQICFSFWVFVKKLQLTRKPLQSLGATNPLDSFTRCDLWPASNSVRSGFEALSIAQLEWMCKEEATLL